MIAEFELTDFIINDLVFLLGSEAVVNKNRCDIFFHKIDSDTLACNC